KPSPPSRMAFTMPPAEKASPAPVRITQRTCPSALIRAAAAEKFSASSGAPSGLRLSGLLMVRVTTGPSFSKINGSLMPDGLPFCSSVGRLIAHTGACVKTGLVGHNLRFNHVSESLVKTFSRTLPSEMIPLDALVAQRAAGRAQGNWYDHREYTARVRGIRGDTFRQPAAA